MAEGGFPSYEKLTRDVNKNLVVVELKAGKIEG
jgi:hypothetical protein